MSKYFTNYDDYTPIVIFIGTDPNFSDKDLKDFTLQFLKFSLSTPRGPKKKSEYFNIYLGKYNIIKNLRGIYSWQRNNWCIYVSEKGFTFEVKETLNAKQAIEAWEDFLLVMGYKNP